MPNYVQTKTIDEIDNVMEIDKLMREFRISSEGCKTLKDMKVFLKDEWSKKTYAFQAEWV